MSTVKGGFSSIVRQAQKMQQQIGRIQDDMGSRVMEASSGGGKVTAWVNGKQELIGLKIAPEVIDPQDPSLLEDLVMAAVGQAIKQSQEMVAEEVNKVTGGINIPGLF
jgi:DNA-binding YbaB/EbfC family protein